MKTFIFFIFSFMLLFPVICFADEMQYMQMFVGQMAGNAAHAAMLLDEEKTKTAEMQRQNDQTKKSLLELQDWVNKYFATPSQ